MIARHLLARLTEFLMTSHAIIYALHVLAALIWVGGMFFAWMVLRPAAVKALQAPQRLQLWGEVLPRFFRWVWLAVLALPISGVGMLHLRQLEITTAPQYVQVMIGLYLAMLALFLRVKLLQLPALQQAIQAQDWPLGGTTLGGIRRLVGLNLLLGLFLISIAAIRPNF